MPAKKTHPKKSSPRSAKKVSQITSTTWILFAVFLVVSAFCFKVIYKAHQVSDEAYQVLMTTQDPVVIPTHTPAAVVKTKAPVKK